MLLDPARRGRILLEVEHDLEHAVMLRWIEDERYASLGGPVQSAAAVRFRVAAGLQHGQIAVGGARAMDVLHHLDASSMSVFAVASAEIHVESRDRDDGFGRYVRRESRSPRRGRERRFRGDPPRVLARVLLGERDFDDLRLAPDGVV